MVATLQVAAAVAVAASVVGCSGAGTNAASPGTAAKPEQPCRYSLAVEREVEGEEGAVTGNLLRLGRGRWCDMSVSPGNRDAALFCYIDGTELRLPVSCVRDFVPTTAWLRVSAGESKHALFVARSFRPESQASSAAEPAFDPSLPGSRRAGRASLPGPCHNTLWLFGYDGEGFWRREQSWGTVLRIGPRSSCSFDVSADELVASARCTLDGVELTTSASCVGDRAPRLARIGVSAPAGQGWSFALESRPWQDQER
jgi:hypothetical protein